MHTFKNQHHCQIDCTNHDEVINNLQVKSKDLYYFWRNYEWLYNKYYSQPKAQEPSQVSTREFEQQIHKLQAQNKKLRIQNQSLRKQNSSNMQNNTSKIQHQYQRQIERLNAKCRDYEGIREKLSQEITTLKNKLRSLQDEADDNEEKLKREIKKQQSIIVDLQRNIDELRERLMKNNGDSSSMLGQKHRRQMHKVKMMMSTLQQQGGMIIEQQFEQMRRSLLEEFPLMFEKLTHGDLNNLIIEQIQHESHIE